MLSNPNKQERILTNLYNSECFIKEIILYSHHEIGWLSHIFNVFESFCLLFQHIANISIYNNSKIANSFWNELIISRPSAITILRQSGYLSSKNRNNKLLLNLLSSRNREVRYHSLGVIV
jgi:hypothetical protein